MNDAVNCVQHRATSTRAHAQHFAAQATFPLKVPRLVLGPHIGLPLCGEQSSDVRGRVHHGHPVLDGMPDLLRGVRGRGRSGSTERQVVAEHLMATTGQLFEDMMATYHSLGIAGKVAGKFIHHPVVLPTALVEMWCGTYQDVLSSVFWTVGDAGTHRHPQFFTESHGSGFRSDHWCRVPGLSRSTLWQDPRQTLADFTLRQRCRRTEQHKPATGTAASL